MRAVNAALGYRPMPDCSASRARSRPRALRPAPDGGAAYLAPWRRSTSTGSGCATGSLTSASLLGYGASQAAADPVRPVPDRPVGAARAVRRGHDADPDPRAARGPLHAPGGLGRSASSPRCSGCTARRSSGSTRGWLNAFGWSNIGIERYFDEYFGADRGAQPDRQRRRLLARTRSSSWSRRSTSARSRARSRRSSSTPRATTSTSRSRRSSRTASARAVPKSRHPVILKVSPDEDYLWQARLAERHGCAGITAINTVKGLRLDPETGEPYLKNRYGADLRPGDQADRAAGRRGAARRRDPAADHRQRRDPRLRRLPRVLLGGRRRRQPRVRGLAPADAAVRAGAARGAADPAADLAGRRVQRRRRPRRTGGRSLPTPHPDRPGRRRARIERDRGTEVAVS